jgi:hypothetical protein
VRFSYGDRAGQRSPTWIDRSEFPASVVLEVLTNTGAQVFAVPFVMPLVSGLAVDCLYQGNDTARTRWCDLMSGSPQRQQQTPLQQQPAPNQTPGQTQPATPPGQSR